MLNDIVKNLLSEVAGMIPTTGAFSIRNNGKTLVSGLTPATPKRQRVQASQGSHRDSNGNLSTHSSSYLNKRLRH